jgi:HSP20 family protein
MFNRSLIPNLEPTRRRQRPLSLFDDFDRELDRWLGDGEVSKTFRPACDVSETENAYFISFDVPGVDKDDIRLEVENQNLIVSGERKVEDEKKTEHGFYSEKSYGSFQRVFALPDTVDPDKIDAHYDNGVLNISIEKKEKTKKKAIEIGSKSPGRKEIEVDE